MVRRHQQRQERLATLHALPPIASAPSVLP
jgi:hypothetical protein